MNKMLFIYNPRSGSGKIRTLLADLVEIFSSNEWNVTVHPTAGPQECSEFIEKEGTGYDLIVAAGGDGILHEAVNGLNRIDFQVPLGCVASGTVNDFINSHHIPADPAEAAQLIVSARPEAVDVGLFNQECFTYVAACGLSTHVSYTTSQDDKKRFGPLAYIVNGLNTVDFAHWENNCVSMNVRWQGGETSGDFLFAAISNTLYIGGSTSLASDDASFIDGKLELLLIRRPMNLHELNTIALGIISQNFDSDFFIRAKSEWIEIDSEPADWTLDGEYGGSWEHVRIETKPQVLKLLRPALNRDGRTEVPEHSGDE